MDRLNSIVVQKIAVATLESWQRATLVGNRAFNEGDFDTACRVYLYSLSLAQGLVVQFDPQSGRKDDSIAALVVSHHNLADLHLRMGHIELACNQLCAVHYQLLRLSIQASGALRRAAHDHLRRTRLELQQLISSNPPAAIADQAMQAFKAKAPAPLLH